MKNSLNKIKKRGSKNMNKLILKNKKTNSNF